MLFSNQWRGEWDGTVKIPLPYISFMLVSQYNLECRLALDTSQVLEYVLVSAASQKDWEEVEFLRRSDGRWEIPG